MSKAQNFLCIGLIMVALTERLVLDLGPNVELVTMASVLAGLYLPKQFKLVVPLIIMFVSDLFLGWGWISLFTWSGFIVMTGISTFLSKRSNNSLTTGALAGCLGVLTFFVWTNFGVWATEIWGMYTNDVSGLTQAYIRGLPFLRPQLLSALVFVPVGIVAVELLRSKRFLSLKQSNIAVVSINKLIH